MTAYQVATTRRIEPVSPAAPARRDRRRPPDARGATAPTPTLTSRAAHGVNRRAMIATTA